MNEKNAIKTLRKKLIIKASEILAPQPIKKFAVPISIAAIMAIITPFSKNILRENFKDLNDTNINPIINNIIKIICIKLIFSFIIINARNAETGISKDQIGSTISNFPFLRASKSKSAANKSIIEAKIKIHNFGLISNSGMF